MFRKLKRELIKPTNLIAVKNMLISKYAFTADVTHFNKSSIVRELRTLASKYKVASFKNSFIINQQTRDPDKMFITGNGRHLIKFQDAYFVIDFSLTEDGDNRAYTSVYISGLNRDREKLKAFIKEALPVDHKLPIITKFKDNSTVKKNTVTGVIHMYHGTREQFIDKDIYRDIDKIIERMKSNKEWYFDRGSPHKETILLEGPPGTGKSTLVRHFASKHDLDVIVITPGDLTKINFNKNRLTIYLLEDIDSESCLLIPETPDTPIEELRGVAKRLSSFGSNPDYSEIINVLDGVIPVNNAIIFMTTNYVEKLKPAVIRPGRVNKRYRIDHPTPERIKSLLPWGEDDPRYKTVIGLEEGAIKIAFLSDILKSDSSEEILDIITSYKQFNKEEA